MHFSVRILLNLTMSVPFSFQVYHRTLPDDRKQASGDMISQSLRGRGGTPFPAPPRLWLGGGFRFRQRRLQPRSGPCGWRPSRVSPPPPPPYCLCEDRGARLVPLPLPPQVTVGTAGRGHRGARVSPGQGCRARSPRTLSAVFRAACLLSLPPSPHTAAEAPAVHPGRPRRRRARQRDRLV